MTSLVLKRQLRHLRLVALAVSVLTLAACSRKSDHPFVPRPEEPGFVADSPENAVRLFEWCWDHRNIEHFGGLFADDFLFECAAPDSAGNAFVGGVVRRADEIETVAASSSAGGPAHPRTASRSSSIRT